MRSRAERLRGLGWRPKEKNMWEMMEEIADDEMARLREGRY